MNHLARWHIHRFGHFVGASQSGLGPGLNVLIGPNEAGKSTLLAFITWVLFGPKDAAERERALARDGDGTLWFDTEEGVWSVARKGAIVHALADGRDIPLDRIVGSADRGLFRRVLAFDLADLRGLESLSDDALRQRLFAAGLTGGGRPVSGVRSELKREMDQLKRQRAASGRINGLQLALRAARVRRNTAVSEAQSLPARRAKLDAMRADHERCIRELATAAEKSATFSARLLARPHAVAHRDAQRRLEELAGLPKLLPETLDEIERVLRDRERIDLRVEAAEGTLAGLRDALAVLPPPDPILAHDGALGALHDGRAAAQTDVRTIEDGTRRIEEAEREIANSLVALGLPGRAVLDAMRVPTLQRAELEERARALVNEEQRLATQLLALESRADVFKKDQHAAQQAVGRLSRSPHVAAHLEEAQHHVRAWGDRVAGVVAELPNLERNASDAASTAASLWKGLGVADRCADAPRTLDEDREIAGQARAAAHRLRSAEEAVQARRADLAPLEDRKTQARRRRQQVPEPGPELAVAPELRRVRSQLDAATHARERAEAAIRRAATARLEAAQVRSRLGRPEGPLPPALGHGDQQELSQLCREAREARTHAAEQLPPAPPGTEVTAAQVEALSMRLLALAKARGAFESVSRPAVDAPRPPIVALLAALGLFALGAGLVAVATFVPSVAVLSLLGLLVLGLALLIALGAAWFAATRQRDSWGPPDLREALTAAQMRADATAGDVRAAEEAARQSYEAARAALAGWDTRNAVARRREAASASFKRAAAVLRSWLATKGLPPDLDPDHAERWVADLTEADRQERYVEAAQADAGRDSGVWERFRADAVGVLARTGRTNDADLPRLVEEASTALEQDERRAPARAEIEAEERTVADAIDATSKALEEATRAHDKALLGARTARSAVAEYGVPDEVPLQDVERWLAAEREACTASRAAERAVAELGRARSTLDRWRRGAAALAAAVDVPFERDDLAPLVARCEAAKRIEDQAQRFEQQLSDLGSAGERLDVDRTTLTAARSQADAALRAWDTLRDACHLPAAVRPDSTVAYLNDVDRALAVAGRLDEDRRDVAAARGRVSQYVARVAAVREALQLPPPADANGAFEAVRQLGGRRFDAQRLEDRRAARQVDRERAEGELAPLIEQRAALAERLSERLAAAGVPDVEAARRAGATRIEWVGVVEEVCRRRQSVEEHLGAAPPDDLASLDPVRLAIDQEAIAEQRQQIEGARDEVARQLAIAEREYDELLQRADVAQYDVEIEGIEQELRVARREYLRIALTDHLLDEALDRFRREKQPAVLQRASALWSLMTGGAWAAVRPTIDADDLEVIDRGGHVAAVGSLSRGTAEQLYLCLRLALAETLAVGGTGCLPLVLDDVLVNFDDERATAAARVLGEVAHGRQVLLFSCRPQTVDLLREGGCDPTVVELPRFAGAAGPIATPARVETPGPRPGRPPSPIGDDVKASIVERLRSENRPLARSDLIVALGLEENTWNRAIRELVEEGAVISTGLKRGTRYTMPIAGP